MKRKQFLRYMVAAVGFAILSPATVLAAGPGGTWVNQSSSTSGVSEAEIAGLKFMREEEKLAHDVYIHLYSFWGMQTFLNISQSETSHTTAILNLLNKYGIPDPAAGKPAGIYEDQDLQQLYNTLVTMGVASLLEALKVGALIEETDIVDINNKKAVTDSGDILKVYDSLLCGSRNHLRSFNSALKNVGYTYIPQVLPQSEWDAIANSPSERVCR